MVDQSSEIVLKRPDLTRHIYQIDWALVVFEQPQDLLYIHASDTYSCIPSEAKKQDKKIESM